MKKTMIFPYIRAVSMLLCGTILYFLINIERVAIPGAIFDSLGQIFQCSAEQVIGFGAVFMYVYAFMQPLTGILLDRLGSIRIMLLGGGLFALGAFFFSLGGDLYWGYFSRIITAAGGGMLYLALVKENMRIFKKNYNLTLAVIILIGYAGGITANAPFYLLTEKIGVMQTLLAIAIIALVSWIIYFFLVLWGKKLPKIVEANQVKATFKEVLAMSHNRKIYIFSALNFGLYYVLQTMIGKKFLQDYCGVEALKAGMVLSFMGVAAASAGMILAFASKIAGNRRQIFCRISGISLTTALSLATILILFNIHNGIIFSILFIQLSLTASLSTIVIPLLKETNHEYLVGKAISILNFTFYFAVALCGNITGRILSFFDAGKNGEVYGRNAYLSVFLFMTILAWVVLIYAFLVKETYGKKCLEFNKNK